MLQRLLFNFVLLLLLAIPRLVFSQRFIPASALAAAEHCIEQTDRYHVVTFVYKDAYGPNTGSPRKIGASDIEIVEAIYDSCKVGPSCARFKFPFNGTLYNAVQYTYPDGNIGQHPGFDMSGSDSLVLFVKGSGWAEFTIGGSNHCPFDFTDAIHPHRDGVGLRSTGYIQLTSQWQRIAFYLHDNTYWVFKNPLGGSNNKYPEPNSMGSNTQYVSLNMNAVSNDNVSCMSASWFGNNLLHWGGFFLFPPEGGFLEPGCNNPGVTKIKLRIKSDIPGKVKLLFRTNEDYCPQDTIVNLTTTWQDITWWVSPCPGHPTVRGGFGMSFGGNLNTPIGSTIYLHSVQYEGIELEDGYSNLMNLLTVATHKSLNPNADSVVVQIDEAYYNKSRLEEPRVAQSFVPQQNPYIDFILGQQAHWYDNDILALAYLALYQKTGDDTYLEHAKKIGDALIYALDHDRFYNDNRLRNVPRSGKLEACDGNVFVPGWFANDTWNEDLYTVSTTTGNMAWSGIALVSLYEVTGDITYFHAARKIANWCLAYTWSNVGPGGFTGGFEGWEPNPVALTWKSTEHAIDLFCLFKRLYQITQAPEYLAGYKHAQAFVYAMWSDSLQCFYTGTDSSGITPDTIRIPADVQAWYILAFLDPSSQYANCYNWVKQNCFVSNFTSPYFPGDTLYGLDYNGDRDGIWPEGMSHIILAGRMRGDHLFADSLDYMLEFIQTHGLYNNGQGIVSSVSDSLSTGFTWDYHCRLHIGATAWFILEKLCINPYYSIPTLCTPPILYSSAQVISCNQPEVEIQAVTSTCTSLTWSGPNNFIAPGNTIRVSAPGTYILTTSEIESGCTFTDSVVVNIDVNAPIISSIGGAITCIDSFVILSATSSIPEVTYFWTDANNFTSSEQNPEVSTPGDYTLEVTNVLNGCSSFDVATVGLDTVPPHLVIEGMLAVNCKGQTTALTASSIEENVNFSWSGGGITDPAEPIQIVSAGIYTVTASAMNGCTEIETIEVTEPFALEVSWSANIDCEGYQDIIPSISGGTPPYSYIPLPPVPPGTAFFMLLTDSNGCSVSLSDTTNTFDPISVSIFHTDETAPGQTDGTAEAEVISGMPPFVFFWNTGDTTQAIDSLAPGVYSVTVTDANLCTDSATIILAGTVSADNLPLPVKWLVLRPNPASGNVFLDIVLEQHADVMVELFDTTSKILWRTEESLLLEKTIALDLSSFSAGVYPVRIWVNGNMTVRRLVVVNK